MRLRANYIFRNCWVVKILLLSLLCCGQALATETMVTVNIRTMINPVSVTGILISTKGTSEQANVSFRRANEQLILVDIPVSASDIKPDVAASAMAVDAEGNKIFGEVKSIYHPVLRSSYQDLSACEKPSRANPNLGSNVYSNVGVFESLLEIREARRKVAQKQIAQVMSGEFLEKLAKLEASFGLNEVEELSSDIDPYSLSMRLFRLRVAVENYKKNK